MFLFVYKCASQDYLSIVGVLPWSYLLNWNALHCMDVPFVSMHSSANSMIFTDSNMIVNIMLESVVG